MSRPKSITLLGVIVTIDGVAASGKSSVASGVARELGVPYVSSGLLYRAATLLALEAGADLSNAAALRRLLELSPLQLRAGAAGNQVLQGGRDLTEDAHTSEVDAGVSAVAQLPELREWVNAQLRALSAPFVAEGRDMGSAVFPKAQAKFFLTAPARVRAQRRLHERGTDLVAVEAALVLRDERDKAQSAPAADARVIDTSALDLPGVIATVLRDLPR